VTQPSPQVPLELHAYGGAEGARVAHERIDLVIEARDGEALERRIEGDLEVALVGEVLTPDLQSPPTVGRADADTRVQQSVGPLNLQRVQIRAGVVGGAVFLIGWSLGLRPSGVHWTPPDAMVRRYSRRRDLT